MASEDVKLAKLDGVWWTAAGGGVVVVVVVVIVVVDSTRVS